VVHEAYGLAYPLIRLVTDYVQSAMNKSTLDEQSSDHSISKIHYFRGHYAVLFGTCCGLLNLSLSMTIRLYLRILLRDLLNAASRLNIIGPLDGARMQVGLMDELESLTQQQLDTKKSSQPLQNNPFIEVIQARHDLLYSRLFNS
jgi:urease accessory protein UreF